MERWREVSHVAGRSRIDATSSSMLGWLCSQAHATTAAHSFASTLAFYSAYMCWWVWRSPSSLHLSRHASHSVLRFQDLRHAQVCRASRPRGRLSRATYTSPIRPRPDVRVCGGAGLATPCTSPCGQSLRGVHPRMPVLFGIPPSGAREHPGWPCRPAVAPRPAPHTPASGRPGPRVWRRQVNDTPPHIM